MVSISEFASVAGDSLVAAQSGLLDDPKQARMAVSEARLDAKVALSSSSDGVAVEMVSLADITSGAVDAAALSTIRLDFVAVSVDPPRVVPEKTPGAVIEEVSGLDDVAALDRIFGGLTYQAEFIDSQQKWLVVARAGDVVVREAIVEDIE